MTQSIRNASQWALKRLEDGSVQDGHGNVLLSGPGALLAQDILKDAMSAPDGPAKTSLLDGLREAVNHVRSSGGAITSAPTFPTWAMYVAAVGAPASAGSTADPVGAFFAPPAVPVPAPVDALSPILADPATPAWASALVATLAPLDQDGRPGPAAPLHAVTDLRTDVDALRDDVNRLMVPRRTRGDGFWARLTQPRVRG
jgi:hypothetical protein